MRRPARILSVLCSAVALILSVAVCALWARSYLVVDRFGGSGGLDDRSWQFASFKGRLTAYTLRGMSQAENAAATNWARDWVVFSAGDVGPASPGVPVEGVFVRRRWFAVPYWLPAAAFMTIAAGGIRAAWRRRRAAHRVRSGRCPACGYDLRASPGRCPECGAEHAG